MGRVMSDKEKKLQRKLIPLNIVAIIISLVCIFSLMFTPIIEIDVGKIISDDSTVATLNNMLAGESSEGGEGEEENGSSESGEVDYTPVISAVLTPILKKAEGSLTISAQTASKVAFAPESEKSQLAMDELLFGDKAVIGGLINSIADAIPTIFESEDTKRLIEEALVKTVISSLVSNLSAEAAEVLNEDNIDKLTDSLRKLEQLEDGAPPDEIADEFVEQLSEMLEGTVNLSEADKESIRDYLIDSYNDTMEYSEDFSVEALISVAISSNVDISSLFGTTTNSNSEGSIALKSLTEEKVGDEGGEGDGGEVVPPENEPSQDPSEDDPNGGEEPDPLPNPSEGENDKVICTTYSELLAQLGFDSGMAEEMKGNLKTFLHDMIMGALGEYSSYFSYYGYVYYAMLGFSALWALMAVFAFLHIFLKNKRFAMWYVKLLGWIPALIWVGIAVGKLAIAKGWIGADFAAIAVVLGGISSSMWICGICYLLLWAISLFWALPIKHKIKKARKAAKEDANEIKVKSKKK